MPKQLKDLASFQGEAKDSKAVQPEVGEVAEPIVDSSQEDRSNGKELTWEESLGVLRSELETGDVAAWLTDTADRLLSLMDTHHAKRWSRFCGMHRIEHGALLFGIIRRCCELGDFHYYRDSVQRARLQEAAVEVRCENCQRVIPRANWQQKYCCNKCSAYHQGSPYVDFGAHDEDCGLKGQSWLREEEKRLRPEAVDVLAASTLTPFRT